MNGALQKIRVLHCITSLDADGAQQMLLKLCETISQERFEFRILNLRGETPFVRRFTSRGIEVENLDMRRAIPSLSALRRISRSIDNFQPDIVQGWMYHGNIAALFAAKLARHKSTVAWNIRKAGGDISDYRPLTRLTLKIGALLSGRAAGVIYCGDCIASQHAALGYSTANQFVIPNGFNTARFCPARERSAEIRESLGVPAKAPVVGLFARYHPNKDHANFIRMAGIVARTVPDTHFVLAGRGMDTSNAELVAAIKVQRISKRMHLLGERSDVDALFPALDVYCLSSTTEGFPNSLGEAMACGLACVTTDAGASREVVGEGGCVVPIGDSEALAAAVVKLLSLPLDERARIGASARERVLATYSLDAVAQKYENFYSSILPPCASSNNGTGIAF